LEYDTEERILEKGRVITKTLTIAMYYGKRLKIEQKVALKGHEEAA
jgi:hypothetical protein